MQTTPCQWRYRHGCHSHATCIPYHSPGIPAREVKELRSQQAVADPTTFRNQRSDVSPHWSEADLYFSGRGKPGTAAKVQCPLGNVMGVGRPRYLIQEVDGYTDRLVYYVHSVFICLATLRSELPFRLSSLLAIYLATAKHYTQTIVELEFSPDDSSDSYDLCYKVYQQTWEQQRVKAIGKDLLKGANVQVAIDELEPGTTYCFRLMAKLSDGSKGEPGPELIIDTEAISCTPKRRRCVIM